ncbi:MAG: hypothetical protein LBP26_02610 [Clostridiales bacterium]|jgi:type IV secretory pathway VirB10-like protein|nr:hypothetical protein [Clostridiales bacterium]
MWEEILRMAAGNGLWAVLFCALLFHQIKDSRRREDKYTAAITTLGERLGVVRDVKKDTELIIKQTAEKRPQSVSGPDAPSAQAVKKALKKTAETAKKRPARAKAGKKSAATASQTVKKRSARAKAGKESPVTASQTVKKRPARAADPANGADADKPGGTPAKARAEAL